MLVLSRKTNERIHVGRDVVITISKIAGNRVVVGIEAPTEVAIHRGELVEKINTGEAEGPRLLQMAEC